LAARLPGIAPPVGGVDWDPPVEECVGAKHVRTHLAHRSALWDRYDRAIASSAVQSVLDMREQLRGHFAGLAAESVVRDG